ncbi:hypothetical protein HMPREF8579_1449 [Streptococcus oralis ATCC 35037]|nr:hypothetical protein HMPREF8579_1449 [Streptococcus oralis ATCC 35037]
MHLKDGLSKWTKRHEVKKNSIAVVRTEMEFFLASLSIFLYNRKSEKRYSMSKKDKKIEIQLTDAKVTVGKDSYEGYVLTIGKKVIGEIAELDSQFAIIKNGNVDSFYKKLEKAVEILIENYNLTK